MADAVFNFLHDYKGLPFRTMTVFNWLLEAALLGGLLILLVLLARALLRGRVGSRALCLAWLLVAARLLAPVALPNPLMNELKPTYSTDAAARPVADQFRIRFIDAMSSLAWDVNVNDTLARADAPYDLANVLSDVAAYTEYGWLGKWYFFAYLAGAGGVAVYMLCRNLAFRRRLRATRRGELSGDALRAYHLLCDELKLPPVPVTLHAGLSDACLVGVARPYIALPEGAENNAAALRRAMLQRGARFGCWALLRDVCCALQWFNPLVWVAAFASRQDQLRDCDERMAAGLTADERAALARDLRKHAARKAQPALSVLATPMTLRAPAMRTRAAALECEPVAPRRGARTGLLVGLGVLLLASFFVANTGFPRGSGMLWPDAGESQSPYVTAQYPNISVENAIQYALADLRDMEGFPESEIRDDRMTAAYIPSGSRYVALYALNRDEAGEAGLSYLERWFPGQDACTLMWNFSDYDTLSAKGRAGTYQPDEAPEPGAELTEAQALAIARQTLTAHWGMSEADAEEATLDGACTRVSEDSFFVEQGWPVPYWKVYLTCHREPDAPCRVTFIDAETGRVFLFWDFVQNG